MNYSTLQTRHRLLSNSKSGQKYTNINTKWTDFKRTQVYLPFPAINVPNIIHRLQISNASENAGSTKCHHRHFGNGIFS